MSRKILAFAASNSSTSVNRQLAEYAASLVEGAEVETLDIHDYEMPIYRHDREEESGIPQLAHDFRAKVAASDGVIISFAEHNGMYCAAFKNLFDWASRIGIDVWAGKPMVLLATSPGPGGAARVLDLAVNAAPHFEGEVKGSMSLADFYDAFDAEAGALKDEAKIAELKAALAGL